MTSLSEQVVSKGVKACYSVEGLRGEKRKGGKEKEPDI
jgi:hypothetical protein